MWRIKAFYYGIKEKWCRRQQEKRTRKQLKALYNGDFVKEFTRSMRWPKD